MQSARAWLALLQERETWRNGRSEAADQLSRRTPAWKAIIQAEHVTDWKVCLRVGSWKRRIEPLRGERLSSGMKSTLIVALSGASLATLSAAETPNLLQNGSFETPTVEARTAADAGGSPVLGTNESSWQELTGNTQAEAGKISFGLTNSIARTGKQSLFIDFQNLTATGRTVQIATRLIPVQPGTTYEISIWGRIDRDRPVALDERRPHMWVDAEFIQQDQQTSAAEPRTAVILVPGNVSPFFGPELLVTSQRWSPITTTAEAPAGAAFLRVIWSWVIGKDEGETDGIAYWDDASIKALPAPESAPAAK